jgi:hypothetical protein
MRGLKNAESWTNYFHAHIKENYVDKDKGHLNHKAIYSAIIKNKILLALPDVGTILRLF